MSLLLLLGCCELMVVTEYFCHQLQLTVPVLDCVVNHTEHSHWDLGRYFNIYISEEGSSKVRKLVDPSITMSPSSPPTFAPNLLIVGPTSTIVTVMGNGAASSSAVGGPALGSGVAYPRSAWADSAGLLYFIDIQTKALRVVVRQTGVVDCAVALSGRPVSCVSATQLISPQQMFGISSAATTIYIADSILGILKFVVSTRAYSTLMSSYGNVTADNVQASTGSIQTAIGVWVNTAGIVFVSEQGLSRVRRISTSPSNLVTTVLGIAGHAGSSGMGGAATSAKISKPVHLYGDVGNRLFVVDSDNGGVVLTVNSQTSVVQVYAGVLGSGGGISSDTPGPATSVPLNSPIGVSGDSFFNIFISEGGGSRVKM
eukprot:gene32964-40687_t